MVHLSNLIVVAASALWLSAGTNAAPTRGEKVELLLRRAITKYEDCTVEQRKKAGQAFADAATMARWTFDETLKDGREYKDTNAYSHYFAGDDYPTVSRMYSAIHQNNDPTNALFYFKVSCKKTDDCGEGDSARLTITDSLPRTANFTPTIRLCPRFFDKNTKETKYDLASKEFEKNPVWGNNSWCKPGQNFADFKTAGHKVLREMTHLDELAKAAGLSQRPVNRDAPNGDKSHGTEDVYELGDLNWNNYDRSSPARSARQLKENWDKAENDKVPILKRVENAMSYAASATEFIFMQRCDFDTIDA